MDEKSNHQLYPDLGIMSYSSNLSERCENWYNNGMKGLGSNQPPLLYFGLEPTADTVNEADNL